MDKNPQSPCNPRVPANITPTAFEELVLDWLRKCGPCQDRQYEAEHLGVMPGAGGDYKIDVLVKLTAFGGAVIIVLVECKHQARPVEREDVLVLESKLRDVGAHKGILFSTSGFQRGAIQYATAHGIATVTVVEGNWLYETRGAVSGPVKPTPWAKFDTYTGIRIRSTENGISCHTIELARVETLKEWFEERKTASGTIFNSESIKRQSR